MAFVFLPPIPIKTKMLNPFGFMTEPWTKFIVKLYERVSANQIQAFIVFVGDETTNLSVGTSKITFRMPFALNLSGVRASVNTAPTGSSIIVDVNKSGNSVLSSKVSIDIGDKSSLSSANPAVISEANLLADDEITVDIDQIGASTPGKGLKLTILGGRP